MPTPTLPSLLAILALALAGISPSAPARTAPAAGNTAGSAASVKAGQEAAPGKHPVVELDTTMGKVTIELDSEKAPISTKNFLEYVNSGFYNGTIFHRVIPGFMVQGGGFTSDMTEKQTRAPIKNEAGNGLSNARGTIAMARTSDPNSATAQFFINVKNNDQLDRARAPDGAGYAVFGKVTSGMDVIDKIVAVKTTPRGQFENVPEQAVVINAAKVVAK